MTTAYPDLLLPDPRVAVLLPDAFTDIGVVIEVLQSWATTDPEIVVLRDGVTAPHCLDEFLREQLWLTTSFVLPPTTDATWVSKMDEVLTYATHLLVVWDHQPSALITYLKSDTRPKRPMKLVSV